MGLQNRESSYIQAVSNRWDIALPQNMIAISPSATAFEEAALYIDAADTLTFETGGGQTVQAAFAAGFVPVRITKVTAQTGTANIYILR
tara:strand:+ start:1107 stop:1373 length:267 start_codon:yes stop_codon:yes gene_type:complete